MGDANIKAEFELVTFPAHGSQKSLQVARLRRYPLAAFLHYDKNPLPPRHDAWELSEQFRTPVSLHAVIPSSLQPKSFLKTITLSWVTTPALVPFLRIRSIPLCRAARRGPCCAVPCSSPSMLPMVGDQPREL